MSRYAIDIRHLRYFSTLAEAGSFTRAASQLHIAQPSLSQHIRNLEGMLGVQLVVRSVRGAALTDDGEKLLRHAHSVIEEMDRLIDTMTAGPPEGDVTLGLPVPVSPIVVRPLLGAMRREYSAVRLHVQEGLSLFLSEWLVDGRLDAAILFANQPTPQLSFRAICSEPLYVVGPAGAFAPGETVRFADLPRYPLIMPNRKSALHGLLHDAAEKHGVDYTVRFEIDVIGELKRFVERGEGYGVLAPVAFHDGLAEGRLSAAALVEPELVRTWMLATRKGQPVSAACRAAADMAAAILAEQTDLVRGRLANGSGAAH